MISLLISLLVLLVVIYVSFLVVDALGLPGNISYIVKLILGLIFLLILLGQIGLFGNNYVIYPTNNYPARSY